jgi:alkylation response protein AidB-like acyl-CoA dehydrogenase
VTLARDAVLDAAHMADRGEPEAAVAVTAAAAKATAVERARRVTATAHQLAGGAGILAEAPFHRWYRRVKDAEPRLGRPRDLRAEVARAALGFSDRGPNWWA